MKDKTLAWKCHLNVIGPKFGSSKRCTLAAKMQQGKIMPVSDKILTISGKQPGTKIETIEIKILRRLTNMRFTEEQKGIILAKALEDADQYKYKYMLRCSRETFSEMLPEGK
jgi:hypothetical protein